MTMSETSSIFQAWPTTYIAIVPRFTGILSAASSSIIIFLICRSASRLSTIYHRIMFGMSIFDIMGSLAMALTSLLMPKKMPLEEELGPLSWPGARYGNTFTCNVQGFCATFGPTCMLGFKTGLCAYYAFAIFFRLKDENIRKYIQPGILSVPIIAGLATAVPPLFYELYNPPIHGGAAWCIAIPFPSQDCTDGTCIRGKKSVFTFTLKLMKIMCGVGAITVIVSLTLVVCAVCFRPSKNIQISHAKGCDQNDKGAEPNANACAGMESVVSEDVLDFASNASPSFDLSRAVQSSQGDQPYAEFSVKRQHYNMEKIADATSYESETPFRVKSRTDNRNHLPVDSTSCHSNQDVPLSNDDSISVIGEHHNSIHGCVECTKTKGLDGNNFESDELCIECRVRMDPKVLAIQAFAYMLVFLPTSVWLAILSEKGDSVHISVFKMWLFFFPLHGFFNLIIFLWHKVYNYRRLHSDTRICEVLYLLFDTPVQEPCVITGMSLVDHSKSTTRRIFADGSKVGNEMGDTRIIARKAAHFDKMKSLQQRRTYSDILEALESYKSSDIGYLEVLEMQSWESFLEVSHDKNSFGDNSSVPSPSGRNSVDEKNLSGFTDELRSP